MAKTRTPIQPDIATEIRFNSDNTCCVCQERGKAIQIHHIDEDPTNNKLENLAVLCLECHNQTQVSGGFGRKLDAPLVIKYRDDWSRRVENRKNVADQTQITKLTEAGIYPEPNNKTKTIKKEISKLIPLIPYINSLPFLKAQFLEIAQPEWDSE